MADSRADAVSCGVQIDPKDGEEVKRRLKQINADRLLVQKR